MEFVDFIKQLLMILDIFDAIFINNIIIISLFENQQYRIELSIWILNNFIETFKDVAPFSVLRELIRSSTVVIQLSGHARREDKLMYSF